MRNLPPQEVISPHFVIDEDASLDHRELLNGLETEIYNNPQLYAEALDIYNAASTKDDPEKPIEAVTRAIIYLGTNAVRTEEFGAAYDRWIKFMKNRVDGEFSFDAATEQAIKADQDMDKYKKLSRINEKLRDLNRAERMKFYIGRVASSQTVYGENGDDEDLEDAG